MYNLTLSGGEEVDRVVIREDQKFGQRIRAWKVEAEVGGVWKPFGNGTGVGNRFVLLHLSPSAPPAPPGPSPNPGKAVCDMTPVATCTTGCTFTGMCGGLVVPPGGKSCNKCQCNAMRTPCSGSAPLVPVPVPVKATALRLTVTATIAPPVLKQFAAFGPGPCVAL